MQTVNRAEVEIRQADFSLDDEYRALLAGVESPGACVLFSGLVREIGTAGALLALELEHYPGMSESSIAEIIAEARARWTIARVRVIHRVGRLEPSAQIVLVGVTSAHRADAFAACSFIMDYLKTRAPFWKKELGANGERWVEHRVSDGEAAARWEQS